MKELKDKIRVLKNDENDNRLFTEKQGDYRKFLINHYKKKQKKLKNMLKNTI